MAILLFSAFFDVGYKDVFANILFVIALLNIGFARLFYDYRSPSRRGLAYSVVLHACILALSIPYMILVSNISFMIIVNCLILLVITTSQYIHYRQSKSKNVASSQATAVDDATSG